MPWCRYADDGLSHCKTEAQAQALKAERAVRLAECGLSRHGVQEYWIVDWMKRQVEIYQREQLALRLIATLYPADVLESPLLPGFRYSVAKLFEYAV